MKASHQKWARRPAERLAALLLLLALAVSLVSCGAEPPIVTEGLTVLETPTVPPSDEAVAEGEQVFLSLLLYATEKRLGGAVPSGTRREIETHARKVALLLAESGVGEDGYRAVSLLLARDGEGAVDEWLAGSDGGYPRLRALYLALTAHLPVGAITELAYTLLDYSYTFRTEAAREDWEKYEGRPVGDYAKQKYEALAAEHATFRAEIGEECFAAALRTLLMLSDLFAESEGDSEALTVFTPAELLIFLDYIPLDGIRTSPEGYTLLLSLLARERGDLPSRLLAAARDAGDLPMLAGRAEGLLTLLVHLRDLMDKEEAILLRERRYGDLLSSLFAKLPEGDWAFLDALATLPLDRAAYDAVGVSEWGDAYTAYAEAVTPATVEELRAAAGSEDFAPLLARYLAAITPVLSYLLEGQ